MICRSASLALTRMAYRAGICFPDASLRAYSLLAVTVPEITPPGAFAVCAEPREAHIKNPVAIKIPPANINFIRVFIKLPGSILDVCAGDTTGAISTTPGLLQFVYQDVLPCQLDLPCRCLLI